MDRNRDTRTKGRGARLKFYRRPRADPLAFSRKKKFDDVEC
jgi:hypothetical protein